MLGGWRRGAPERPPCPPSPVFVTLTCAFRYGREDLDVLGLSFRKDLFIATYQAFPPMPNPPRPPTRLQERLLRKLGQHAHPFFFTVRTPLTLCRARGLGPSLERGRGWQGTRSGQIWKKQWRGGWVARPTSRRGHPPCLLSPPWGPFLLPFSRPPPPPLAPSSL